MALVACRECGREVSSEARACPHCGVTLARSGKRIPFAIVALCVVVIGAVWLFQQHGSEKAGLRRLVSKNLHDPESAQFRHEKLRKTQDGVWLCGEVNARNRFGAMVGFRPFIAGHGYVGIENKSDAGENFIFAGLYAARCGAPHVLDAAEIELCRDSAERAARSYDLSKTYYENCNAKEQEFFATYGFSAR